MNKYYTPKIEEFHVGFEYEAVTLNIEKQVNEYKKFNVPFVPDTLKIMLESDFKPRVKYLDKEDIESLGFTTKKLEYWETEEDSIIYRKDNYAIVFWKNAYKSDYKTNIYIKQETGLGLHSFKGECKNKSELKRLLKQLNIDE
jgi:hypothetical protein